MRFESLWASGPGRPWCTKSSRPRSSPWTLPAAAVMAMAALTGLAQGPGFTPSPGLAPTGPIHPPLSPAINRPPDANLLMEMREHKSLRKNFDTANAERLRQMIQASLMLETIAMALKAEVDKTNSEGLSESAVRKAENIEKLAQIVKEKMKLMVLPN